MSAEATRPPLAHLLGGWLPPVVAFVTLAVLWQWVARHSPELLPTLEAVAGSLIEHPLMYWQNLLVTCQEIAIGAGAGIVCGFVLAALMTELPLIEKAAMPLIVVIMVTPMVAIAPALVIAFGYGMLPKYVVTGLVVLFPMLVNSLAGLREVDPKTLDVFKTLNASRREVFRHLRLPGSLPFVFAGLRIAMPSAVVGAAVAEYVSPGQQAGLGSLVNVAAAQANLPVIWASIALLCVLGVILITLLALVRRRVLWWSKAHVIGR